MSIEQFWRLIEESKKNEENQVEWLQEQLAKQSIDDIVDFDLQLRSLLDLAYTSSLWGAAYLIMGGCSDDAFEYFRAWLIAQGEKVFLAAIQNPEYLASYIPNDYSEEGLMPQLEELLSVAPDAYTYLKTGEYEFDNEIYDEFEELLQAKGYEFSSDDIEFDWEDEDDLKEMFPILWSRFGENPL